jgi:hypothetical protein
VVGTDYTNTNPVPAVRDWVYHHRQGYSIEMRSFLRVSQVVLAALVLLIATITFSSLPQPYPTWPTVGAVPVNPELVIPGLLGLVAILRALHDGIAVGSIVIGVLGAVTLWAAATSLHTLYSSTGGGVFWGGFFTLISGSILAIGVIGQSILRQTCHHIVAFRIQDRFGD